MSKYVIKEELINEFLGSFFTMLAKRKGKSIAKKFQSDPEMQRIIKDGEKVTRELKDLINKRRKVDPEYKAASDEFRKWTKELGLDT